MATQSPALNEKPRYCWLNSNKMDGSNENGMAIRMAAGIKNGGEKRRMARQPKQQNNSGETAITMVRENSKIKIKASKIE